MRNDFFAKRVSTSGGRTTHFEISAEGISLKFPNVQFPRREKWIEAGMELHTEAIEIDWKRIGNLLLSDNGIYYGNRPMSMREETWSSAACAHKRVSGSFQLPPIRPGNARSGVRHHAKLAMFRGSRPAPNESEVLDRPVESLTLDPDLFLIGYMAFVTMMMSGRKEKLEQHRRELEESEDGRILVQ